MRKTLLIVALLLTTSQADIGLQMQQNTCLFSAKQFDKSLTGLNEALKTGNQFLIRMKMSGIQFTAVSVIEDCDFDKSGHAKPVIENAKRALDLVAKLEKKGY